MDNLHVKDLIFAFIFHWVVLICVGFLLWLVSEPQVSTAFVAGSLLMLIDCMSYVLLFRAFLLKKYIALSLFIIVCKYPILFYLMYALTTRSRLSAVWLSLGVLQIVITLLALAIKNQRTENERS